jgi:hypothetical protein
VEVDCIADVSEERTASIIKRKSKTRKTTIMNHRENLKSSYFATLCKHQHFVHLTSKVKSKAVLLQP